MNIIIEGCDCVGKTSIINELKKINRHFKTPHCHAPKDKESAKAQYLRLIANLIDDDLLVFDRALLGETVYAPLKRGYFPEYMRDLEKMVPGDTYLFLIICDLEEVYKRFDGEFLKREELARVLDDFKTQFELSNYSHKHIIDTTNITAEEAAQEIIRLTIKGENPNIEV